MLYPAPNSITFCGDLVCTIIARAFLLLKPYCMIMSDGQFLYDFSVRVSSVASACSNNSYASFVTPRIRPNWCHSNFYNLIFIICFHHFLHLYRNNPNQETLKSGTQNKKYHSRGNITTSESETVLCGFCSTCSAHDAHCAKYSTAA